jgi:hypothetical protein
MINGNQRVSLQLLFLLLLLLEQKDERGVKNGSEIHSRMEGWAERQKYLCIYTTTCASSSKKI